MVLYGRRMDRGLKYLFVEDTGGVDLFLSHEISSFYTIVSRMTELKQVEWILLARWIRHPRSVDTSIRIRTSTEIEILQQTARLQIWLWRKVTRNQK